MAAFKNVFVVKYIGRREVIPFGLIQNERIVYDLTVNPAPQNTNEILHYSRMLCRKIILAI